MRFACNLVALLALLATYVEALAKIKPHLQRIESSSTCSTGPCYVRVKACSSDTEKKEDRQCTIYTSENSVNAGDPLKFYFFSADLKDVETTIPHDVWLSVAPTERLQFYDGGNPPNTMADQVEVLHNHLVSEAGTSRTSYDEQMPSGIIFTFHYALVTTCSSGSYGKLCTCPSGSIEITLSQITNSETQCALAGCTMSTKICGSDNANDEGSCAEFSSSEGASGYTVFTFSDANFALVEFDLPGTVHFTMTPTLNDNSNQQTATPAKFTFDITSDSAFTGSHQVTFFSTTYTVFLAYNAVCLQTTVTEDSECYGDTLFTLISAMVLNNDSAPTSCTTGPCSLEVQLTTDLGSLQEKNRVVFKSDNIVKEGDNNIFLFKSAQVASYIHSLPKTFKFLAKVQHFDFDGHVASEVYADNATVTKIRDERVDINVPHADGNYWLQIHQHTTGVTESRRTKECIQGIMGARFSDLNVSTSNGLPISCTASSGCVATMTISILGFTSRESFSGTFMSENIVSNGDPLLFHYNDLNIVGSALPFPESFSLDINMTIYSGATPSSTAKIMKVVDIGLPIEKDFTTSVDSGSDTYTVNWNIRAFCGNENIKLIKGNCTKYGVVHHLAEIYSVNATCNAQESCLIKAKLCIHDQSPASDGVCKTFMNNQLILPNQPIETVYTGAQISEVQIQAGSTVYYSLDTSIIKDGQVANIATTTEGSYSVDGLDDWGLIEEDVNLASNTFTVLIPRMVNCVEGFVCPERDHYDCRIYERYADYYCSRYQAICHKYCPYMCKICSKCDRPACFPPTCYRSQFGCRYEPENQRLLSLTECKMLGVCGKDHPLCQMGFSGRNHHHPCHRCKYASYAKHVCPFTCGLCPMPCQGKKCLNGGKLDTVTCTCCCSSLYTGDTCETLNCPMSSQSTCMVPRWYCKWFPIPQECGERCEKCTVDNA